MSYNRSSVTKQRKKKISVCLKLYKRVMRCLACSTDKFQWDPNHLSCDFPQFLFIFTQAGSQSSKSIRSSNHDRKTNVLGSLYSRLFLQQITYVSKHLRVQYIFFKIKSTKKNVTKSENTIIYCDNSGEITPGGDSKWRFDNCAD